MKQYFLEPKLHLGLVGGHNHLDSVVVTASRQQPVPQATPFAQCRKYPHQSGIISCAAALRAGLQFAFMHVSEAPITPTCRQPCLRSSLLPWTE